MTTTEKLALATIVVQLIGWPIILVLAVRLRKINEQTRDTLLRTQVHAEAMVASVERLNRTLMERLRR